VNRILKSLVWSVFAMSVFCIQCVGLVSAEELQAEQPAWRGGIHLGYSHYTALIGGELNAGHWAFTAGLPAAAGVKYYPDSRGYRWFVGAHVLHLSSDVDETEDGIRYDGGTYSYAGMGLGYKWRWKDHWDLTLSLSVAYWRRELETNSMARRDDYIGAIPGLTFGYTF
jgi:hypothetical protein